MADNANAVTCITPHAVFYIHKMRDTVTNRNFQIYYRTPGLNEWIAAQGGEPDQDNRGLQGMLRMTYKDAKNFWKTCQN